MGYPREVGIVKFIDGTYDCYPDCVGVSPSVDYIQKDLAQSLADALERMVNHVAILPPDMDQPGSVMAQARAALANYRKGE